MLCGALQPLSGALIDRLGARGVCCASMLLHALGLLVLAAARGPGALGLGFLIVRVGGISGTFLAQDAVLTKWYVRSRGTVVAVQRCVMAVGAISAIPMAVGAAIPRMGWRGTLVALALPLLLAVPTAGAFLLPTPESAGVRPDGDKAAPPDAARVGAEREDGEELLPLACDGEDGEGAAAAPPARTAADDEVMWTVREALRCRVFWSLLGIGLAVCCCTGGITAHTPLIAADAGLDLPAMSRAVLLPSAIIALFANFGAGRALDAGAVSVRALFAAAELALAFAALMALAMGTAPSRPRCIAAACFFGGSYGAGTAGMYFTYKLAFSNFFGRKNYGAIGGIANVAMFIGIGLGPVLFGIVRDKHGSYNGALRASAATCAACACATWVLVAPPTRRPLLISNAADAEAAGRAPLLAADDAAA